MLNKWARQRARIWAPEDYATQNVWKQERTENQGGSLKYVLNLWEDAQKNGHPCKATIFIRADYSVLKRAISLKHYSHSIEQNLAVLQESRLLDILAVQLNLAAHRVDSIVITVDNLRQPGDARQDQ